MNTANKRIFWRTTAFMIVGTIIQYALFHAANILKYNESGVALSYVTYYCDVIWGFFFPALSAITILVTYVYCGRKTALLNGAVYAATRAAYYIPLGYLMSIGYGYDSLESLLGGIIIALASCAAVYVEVIFTVALALLPTYIKARRRASALSDILRSELICHDSLDVTLGGTAAVGIISLIQFLKTLVSEIADTVDFFSGGSYYTTGEVLYVIFKYLFAIGLLTGFYFLLTLIKRRFVDSFESETLNEPTQPKEI